jgi:hypothetical protein
MTFAFCAVFYLVIDLIAHCKESAVLLFYTLLVCNYTSFYLVIPFTNFSIHFDFHSVSIYNIY